uniref:CAP-Gly domain-containing protein n=1 Tax=Mucochytrium quahogii TaxID=96639 RepID=A0A7S2W2E0_9STRA|mmetsp:Transcript_8886/g.14437  ORF Transcript_8886/g.14437 Transcript_8886/m.14437 type:complete len:491 (+) Transcript_8886:303-1775(+)|eukprot:CAMPEP_0203760702 /NCGR_PEP_ID=MMETSP0098-20131031/13941_1 /ASSEMBLY_ACC=CAM_ASM_000208 /TAXON_ID=96639 /ORGANISM=" , Strain NY0313808BC1" /LENGTH=490 /DNA_ID=CAMNT_0050654387 /DNA_START=280 /DNA_END=1752 /DNA_ORIENTATION=-
MPGLKPGRRVQIKSSGETGYVAYIGRLQGKSGEFIGVSLDRPVGKNDGSVNGKRYFDCGPNRGTFVREENVHVISSNASRGSGKGEQVLGKYSAARSHELTEEYMEEFEKGFAQLAGPGKSDPFVEEKNPIARSFDPGEFESKYEPRFEQSRCDWGQGPTNPEGNVFDASDQPLMCAALSPDGRECVVGGCDHGLRVFEVSTGREKRNLFTKRFGHREWVTDCTYCPDGSILSAGMDSKMCLWKGTRCTDLEGHRGSISKTLVTENGRNAISCSYDKTVRVWSLSRSQESGCFKGHKSPILEMALNQGILFTGSRDGMVMAWDLGGGSGFKLRDQKQNGHVTSLTTLDDTLFVSGDQSGTVRIWDVRDPSANTVSAGVHSGGAVNAISSTTNGDLVTAGADKAISYIDPRQLSRPIYRVENHKDFIYSLALTSTHILSGSGDGLLLVHELSTGRLNYGLGANTAGVRCILTSSDYMIAAGDDGKAMTYFF